VICAYRSSKNASDTNSGALECDFRSFALKVLMTSAWYNRWRGRYERGHSGWTRGRATGEGGDIGRRCHWAMVVTGFVAHHLWGRVVSLEGAPLQPRRWHVAGVRWQYTNLLDANLQARWRMTGPAHCRFGGGPDVTAGGAEKMTKG